MLKPRRIDQLLSRYGYCSRSEARSWIRDGRVQINGAIASSPDDKAQVDALVIDGAPIESPHGILAMLYKPAGYACSHDSRENPLVYDLLPPRWLKRNPPVTSIGRLDRDTTGVLLLTDNGALIQKWTSPRHHWPKVYEVQVDRDLNPELIDIFASGKLVLEGENRPCLPAHLELMSLRDARLELIEGRYHQIKRMFASQGFGVQRLHRSRFGAFELAELQPGDWKMLPLVYQADS